MFELEKDAKKKCQAEIAHIFILESLVYTQDNSFINSHGELVQSIPHCFLNGIMRNTSVQCNSQFHCILQLVLPETIQLSRDNKKCMQCVCVCVCDTLYCFIFSIAY